jgi:hypothetical protein
VDLWQEGLRVARRLVDPNHEAPAQTAIGGLREGDLGGAGRAEPGVLPDRVEVPVDGLAANSGRKSLDRTACPAIDTDATCCTSIGIASDQVLPPSVERITAAVKVEPLPRFPAT